MTSAGDILEFQGARFSCERCGLGQGCIGHYTEAEAQQMSCGVGGRHRVQRAGSHLFRVGDRFNSLYVIRSGSVKTYLTSEDGEEQILGFHRPGDVIGFDAIAEGRHPCSAAALETSSVCILSFSDLSRLCQHSAPAFHRLVETMSRETLRLVDSLLLGRRTAEQRVAAFLLTHADRQGERGYSPKAISLAMSRTDIGKYLGLTVETVSRILTRFQDVGLLTKERNQIRVHDLEALRHMAGDVEDGEIASCVAGE